MIVPRRGMGEKVILRIPASSEFGAGTLCVTSMAVAYEVQRRGIYLDFVPLAALKGTASLGGIFEERCRICWEEDGSEHTFEFRTRHYKKLRRTLDSLCAKP